MASNLLKQVIWKYEVPLANRFTLQIPRLASVLSVQTQNDKGYIWVALNPDDEPVAREFVVVGTGHPFSVDRNRISGYIGTFQIGPFVWHLYEDGSEYERLKMKFEGPRLEDMGY